MRRSSIETQPWVGFSVGESRLAVEAALVRGISSNRDLVRVPFSLGTVAGVLIRGGRVVPVFDFGRVPGAWNRLPGPGGAQVIILGEGEIEAGVLADGAETFREEPPAEGAGLKGAPESVREGMLSGVLRRNGRAYGILRVAAALHAAGIPATFSG